MRRNSLGTVGVLWREGTGAWVSLLVMTAFFFGVRAYHLDLNIALGISDSYLATKLFRDAALLPGSLSRVYFEQTGVAFGVLLPSLLVKYLGWDPLSVEWGRFLVIHLLSALGYFYLSYALFKDRWASSLAVLLLMGGSVGSLSLSFRSVLAEWPLNHYLGLALVAVVLALFFQGRYLGASAVAGVLFNIHPSQSVSLFALLALYFLLRRGRLGYRVIAISVGLYALLALPLAANAVVFGWLGNAQVPAEDWWRLMYLRKGHHLFPSQWGLGTWAYMGAFLFLFWLSGKNLAGVLGAQDKRERREKTLLTLAMAGLLTLLGFVLVEVWPVPAAARLALPRASSWVVLLGTAYLAAYMCCLLRQAALRDHLVAWLIGIGLIWFAVPPPAVLVLVYAHQDRRLSGWPFFVPLLFLSVLAALALTASNTLPLSGAYARYLEKLHLPFSAVALGLYLVLEWWEREGHQGSRWSGGSRILAVLLWVGVTAYHASAPAFLFGADALAEAKAWKDIQLWSKENTPPDAVFVTPPTWDGFENYAERAEIINWAKVGWSIYTPQTFAEEVRRIKDYGWDYKTASAGGAAAVEFLERKYDTLSEADLARFKEQYNASYAVVKASKRYALERAYENESFAIYRLGGP